MKILTYSRGGLTLTVPAHNIMIFEVAIYNGDDLYFRIFGYTERYPLRLEQVSLLKEFLLSKNTYLSLRF